MKNWKTRWDETINYLNTAFPRRGLGDHINTVVTKDKLKETISKELSIGKNPGKDGEDDPAEKSNPQQRHALRGLLLCQRVYFSDLWAKTSMINGSIVATNGLIPTWKADSLKFWGGKNEQAINAGIAMFVTDETATLDDVVRVAKTVQSKGKVVLAGHLTISRTDKNPALSLVMCYTSIQTWLVLSGVMSMRWLMMDVAPSGEASLKRLFGEGKVVWDGKNPFLEDSVLKSPKAGHVAHMWMDEGNWNGHWVISNGDDGTFCGFNNGIVKDENVGPGYANNGTLRAQFEGYSHLLKENDPSKGYTHPRMVVYNPLKIPARL